MNHDAAGKATSSGENRILTALPEPERHELFGLVRNVSLPVRTVLFEPGAPIEALYFPTDGVVSLVTPLQDGAIVEVATIGNEGIVGVRSEEHTSELQS